MIKNSTVLTNAFNILVKFNFFIAEKLYHHIILIFFKGF